MTGKTSILVTGASGIVGPSLCAGLAQQGYQVRSFTRHPSEQLAGLGVDQYHGDVANDMEALRRAINGVDVCVHAAALADSKDPRSLESVNVTGTQNVIDACKASGVTRLVLTSSAAAVYGVGQIHDGTDETLPYPAKWISDYGRTKAEAEQKVAQACGDLLQAVILRLVQVVTPENHRLTGLLKRGGTIYGNGENRWDWVSLPDTVQAHVRAVGRLLSDTSTPVESYFISSRDPVGYAAFMNGLSGAMGLSALETMTLAEALTLADKEEARQSSEPGYKAKLRRAVVEKLSGPQWHRIDKATRPYVQGGLGFQPESYFEAIAAEFNFLSK